MPHHGPGASSSCGATRTSSSHHRRRYTLARARGARARRGLRAAAALLLQRHPLSRRSRAVRVARRLRGEPKGEVEVRLHDDEARARERHADARLRRRRPLARRAGVCRSAVSLVCLAERRALTWQDGRRRAATRGDSRALGRRARSSTSGAVLPELQQRLFAVLDGVVPRSRGRLRRRRLGRRVAGDPPRRRRPRTRASASCASAGTSATKPPSRPASSTPAAAPSS